MSIGPSVVRLARSWIRQSFMLSRRTSPSSTSSAESPPGPSLIEVSTWMVTCSPPGRSTGRAWRVRTKRSKPSPQHALELVGRIARQEHRGRAVDVLSEEGEIEVVPVEVRDVEEVRVLDGVTHVVGSWSLRKGNHEPKKAGTNHGSQTMVPRAVSMRMPA